MAGRYWKRQVKENPADSVAINRRWEKFLERKRSVVKLRKKRGHKIKEQMDYTGRERRWRDH